MTTKETAQNAVESLRQESRVLLRKLLGIREGESNGQEERLLECIHGAAMLEAVLVMTEAAKTEIGRSK